MIEIKNLTKAFDTPRGRIFALEDFSLSVNDGTFLGIAGKSGAGKSTLLSLVAGLQKPSAGRVLIDGTDIFSLSDKQLSSFRNEKIGFISQEQSFLENLSVLDNVRLPHFLSRRPKSADAPAADRALSLLESVGIAHLSKSYPSSLSGGENHRVLIARALMNDPSIILADEPTDSVDAEQTENIVSIFKRLAASGKTVLFVTHDEAALRECDCVARIP